MGSGDLLFSDDSFLSGRPDILIKVAGKTTHDLVKVIIGEGSILLTTILRHIGDLTW